MEVFPNSPRGSLTGRTSNPNSPRRKKLTNLASFWVKHREFRVNERHNFEQYGMTIRRAMEAGQQSAIIIRIMKNECIVSNEDSVPLTSRGGLHSKHAMGVVSFHDCMTPLLEWVAMHGLLWRIGSNLIGGTLSDIHSPWSDFTVYWQPKLRSKSTLMSLWLNYCTIKCVDGSRAIEPEEPLNKIKRGDKNRDNPLSWYEMVYFAMSYGQQYCILCTIHHDSDFTYQSDGYCNSMIRKTMTMEYMPGEVNILGNKFDYLFCWIREQNLKYCYILDDAKEVKWAYIAAVWEM